MRHNLSFAAPIVLIFSFAAVAGAQSREIEVPGLDRRLTDLRDHNTAYRFTPYRSKEEWLRRAGHLRMQILVGAGLWPMPVKTPLNARVFGRVEHADYSVEKVYFQSHPGFLVTGNLYKPRGKTGPFPAIVSPHGHWTYGRLENTEICSVPGRSISFARQGYVVFSLDMIGYNDSRQLTHRFGGPREELWGISLGGLQLWNLIRSVDFLSSLGYVDRERIGATGASGGGTQTFLLMAVDDRVKAGAPVNMVSAHMQGGCLCENIPGLRIDTFNVELAALAAPRPLLLVSATGDWTANTMKVEYPAIQSIYRLFDAAERVNAVQVNAGHNYNKESREAVYSWFGRWFLDVTEEARQKERSFRPEPTPELLVFYGLQHPYANIDDKRLTEYLISSANEQLAAMKPAGEDGLTRFSREMRPALAHSLATDVLDPRELVTWGHERKDSGRFTIERFFLGRSNRGDRIPATRWSLNRSTPRRSVTLVVHERGRSAISGEADDQPSEMVLALLNKGQDVLSVDCFQTGDARGSLKSDQAFFTTYNRPVLANRVQDILTALAYLKSDSRVNRLSMVGVGKAGLWCLLARGLARGEVDRAVVDVSGFGYSNDEDYLKDLYAPSIRRVGDLRTAIVLAAPSSLLIHNAGSHSPAEWASDVYKSLGAGHALQIVRSRLSDAEVVRRLTD